MKTPTKPTPIASLEEHVDFFKETVLISVHDTQTNSIYYPAQVLTEILNFATVEQMMTHETWMQAMTSFRRQTGRLVSRWVSVSIHAQETLFIDKAFLDLPELADFLAGERTLPCVSEQATELTRWEQILNQPNWTEEEFTHLLAVVFTDYGHISRVSVEQSLAC